MYGNNGGQRPPPRPLGRPQGGFNNSFGGNGGGSGRGAGARGAPTGPRGNGNEGSSGAAGNFQGAGMQGRGFGGSSGAAGNPHGFGRGGGHGGFSGGAGNFQGYGMGRGSGNSSGGAGNFHGRGMRGGFGGAGGAAGNPHGFGRGGGGGPNGGSSAPVNASTGPRNDNVSSVTGLALPVECYKPPEHSFVDQLEAAKKNMGMDERDTICLRCGKDKGDVQHTRNSCDGNCVRCPDDPTHPPTYCPRLYCTRSWHKRHGWGKMPPIDKARQGLCRIRPSNEEIDKLVKMGELWAKDIKKVAASDLHGKRTAEDAFANDAGSVEEAKRLKTVNGQLSARVISETKLRRAAEEELRKQRAVWLAMEAHYKRIIYDYKHGLTGVGNKDASHQNFDVDGLEMQATATAAEHVRANVDAIEKQAAGVAAEHVQANANAAGESLVDAMERQAGAVAAQFEEGTTSRPAVTQVGKEDEGAVDWSDSSL